MAMINFDCPECGHNLEVDENGAGFIVKCPECDNPLQIPEPPKSRRIRKTAGLVATLVAIVLLLGINIRLWHVARVRAEQLAEQQSAFDDLRQQTQALAMRQEADIAGLQKEVEAARQAASDDLARAALDVIDEAEILARKLEENERSYLDNHAGARTALLRENMTKVISAAKNSLPAPPVITDVGPGRGIQGRQIVFPILPNRDAQTLRENAEVTGIDEDKVSFRFIGGGATYTLTELHPGVAAYLPVDPLLVLPRRQWAAEVIRIHQLQTARREEKLAELRRAIETHLPAD